MRTSARSPSDDTLWCWGDDQNGQLGLGENQLVNATPRQVGTETNWKSVVCGYQTTCALKADLTRYCWGLNDSGQYGDGLSWRAGFAVTP